MGWRVLTGAVVASLVSMAAAAPPRGAPDRFRVSAAGNELIASRLAPVRYSSLEQLLADITRPLPASTSPIRIVRASPPESIGYVFCVTREGTLVVGQQTFDVAGERPRFLRGEIARAYSPVERPGPWAWIVEIPLSREVELAFAVQATAGTWPIRSVTITLDREP
jgi:hypothetical protein